MSLLEAMEAVSSGNVSEIRYRGNGWPGRMSAKRKDEKAGPLKSFSYEYGWGEILQKHRPWRCHVCADHTGEFADIAVGDPWHRPVRPGEPGRSLIVARTRQGADLIRRSIDAGYLVAEQVPNELIEASQPNLLRTRAALWGRLAACRFMGAATPRYRGMPMFRLWLRHLSLRQKLQSLLGTARRVIRRGLRRPVYCEQIDTDKLGLTSVAHVLRWPDRKTRAS
jgi:coenzyme F420 hydrogenase subunit beta